MYYFAYGMNTDPAQMRNFAAEPVGRAELLAHSFHFSVHADVRPEFDSVVDGVLWEIDDETLVDLDAREGYPDYYTRDLQPVKINGKIVEAWCYAMRPEYRMPTAPARGYLAMLYNGYKKFNVPTDQIDQALAEFK
jgi:gamma-glutamylcyclotransferase (GGCT)/AIG2-like uncharacterized protein YtfP